MALLHVWNFPLYFTPGFAKLCANDESPYIHMNVLCKVEMFSLPGNYFLFQWLCILVLSPVLFLPVQCSWGEIPLSSEFQPCLTGTENSFHDSVEGTPTKIPGRQKNNPENPGLMALWLLLRLENGNTTQLNSYQFIFSASWGCHSGLEELWFIFSLYGYFPVVLQVLSHLQNTQWSSKNYRCKDKIVSCLGLSR